MPVNISSLYHDHNKYVAMTNLGQVVIKNAKIVQGEEICKSILNEGVETSEDMKDAVYGFLNRVKKVVKKDGKSPVTLKV